MARLLAKRLKHEENKILKFVAVGENGDGQKGDNQYVKVKRVQFEYFSKRLELVMLSDMTN